MKIEVKNVSKKFKDITVLQNINMEFQNGKIYGLVGRNGSGKSVLLKMICAFYEPTDGEILFDGENIIKNQKFPPNTRALIEKPYFMPDLSGFENLKLLASIDNKTSDEKILETLKLVNLYEEKDKKFSKYSLGMKQKLGIAQVLMDDPEIIILDEPFNGLEEATTISLRKVLLDLKKQGKMIILATHIKEDIKELVDILYTFDAGNVKEEKITIFDRILKKQ